MKVLHECERNIPKLGLEVYTYDKRDPKSWYIQGFLVFYCPYCGVELRKIKGGE